MAETELLSDEGLAMMNSCKPFPLGRVVATPATLSAMAGTAEQAKTFLDRHAMGDWGEVDSDDWTANDEALRIGERLLSVYLLQDATKIWVITEADRSVTTMMLPDEF